jgi:hypothetical protein
MRAAFYTGGWGMASFAHGGTGISGEEKGAAGHGSLFAYTAGPRSWEQLSNPNRNHEEKR